MSNLTTNGVIGKSNGRFGALEAASINCDALAHKPKTIAVAAARTLLESESGSTILVDSASAYTITLPATSAAAIGLRYKFIKSTETANAVTIAPGSAGVFEGTLLDINTTTDNQIANGATTSIVFDSGTLFGDFLEIECISATVWHVFGMTRLADGFTINA